MTENTTQPEVVATQPEVATVEPQVAPQTIKVKYNKQDLELPYEEAVKHIQKGMNYDKLHEKYQSLESKKAYKWLNEVAKKNNVDVDVLADKWAKELEEQEAQRIAEEKNIPTEVAQEYLKTKQELEQYRNQVLTIEQQAKQQELIDNQISEFRAVYPDVKDQDIPDEVLERARDKSIPLLEAYEAYQAKSLREQVKQLEEQLKIKQVNDANAQSSMGSAQSAGDTYEGELTEELVKQMTSEQRRKQLERKDSPLWALLNKPRK